MSNTKISALTPGTPAQSTDVLPIDRAGANFSLTASDIIGGAAPANVVSAAGTLTANQLIIGEGSKAEAALGVLGTTTTVLHGNASGAPTFGAVALTTDVSGTLPVANGGTNQTQAGQYGVMIARSYVQVNQSLQAEAVVFAATVPASLMSANGVAKIQLLCKNGTVTGNVTYRVRVAATGSGLTGTILNASVSSTTTANFAGEVVISNRNATNSQVSGSFVRNASGIDNDVNATASIDTTAAWDIVVTIQLANADTNGGGFMGASVVVYP